ncbi:MAG: ABC transporter substrate-binding protein [Alphaproteobacteria bacterium]|nr:ABC transporter substrate-binding protein [Alphaproteobacteria bacterium]
MFGSWAKKRFVATWAIVLILTIGAAPAPALAAPDPDRAMRFVRTGLDEVISILSEESVPEAERVERLHALLLRTFDIPTVGKFALGVHRRGIDQAKLTIYLQAFEDHVVEAYIKRLVRLVEPELARSAKDFIHVIGTQPAGKTDIFVRMSFDRTGKDPVEVFWRVRERRGRLQIIDVNFLGISLAMTYRQEFASVISRRGNGVDGLISALKEHATEINLGGE